MILIRCYKVWVYVARCFVIQVRMLCLCYAQMDIVDNTEIISLIEGKKRGMSLITLLDDQVCLR